MVTFECLCEGMMKFNKLPQSRIEIYRRMTPQERIEAALELCENTYEVMKEGLRSQHPQADEDTIQKMAIKRMEICRKNNF